MTVTATPRFRALTSSSAILRGWLFRVSVILQIEGADNAFAGSSNPLEEGFRIFLVAQKGCRCGEAVDGMNGAGRDKKRQSN